MKQLSVFLLSTLIVLFSCKNQTPKEEPFTEIKDIVGTTIEKPASARPVHWSCTEEGGPEGWAALSPVYAACGSGKIQSPINLLTNSVKGRTEWKIEYKTTS